MEKTQENTAKELLTRQQQKAIHVWFNQVADEFNQEGKSISVALQKFIVESPATGYMIKEFFWKPLQEAILGKKSTTLLNKKQEIDKIYDALNKFFGEEMQLQVPPFPSFEEQSLQEYATKIYRS